MLSLYLASGSPRRRELLTQIDVPFSTVIAAIDETPFANESPVAYVERLALEKARAGFDRLLKSIIGSSAFIKLPFSSSSRRIGAVLSVSDT